jgi:hypothetical protein
VTKLASLPPIHQRSRHQSRRATPRLLVHTDVSDHAWPQADRGNPYNPASASPNPRQNPHSARGTAPAYVPRFRALALFGRRPQERVEGFVMPASKNLHSSGLMRRTIIVETLPVAACISRSPGAGKKTALRRSLRNPIGCFSQMVRYVLFPAGNFSQFHSALMLAARTTLAHASVFSTTNFARSAGELTNASPPKSAIRS